MDEEHARQKALMDWIVATKAGHPYPKPVFTEAEHIVAKPFREDLICMLQPLYRNSDLSAYSHDQLFDIYKKNIEAGTIQYDKSRGYLGTGCPSPSSSSQGGEVAHKNASLCKVVFFLIPILLSLPPLD